jgi:uncharacterized glyoxalase superfamily protein PhnB
MLSTKSLADTNERHHMSDAPANITPKALAAELGIDPKRLRGHLRKNHSRAAEAKNTTWLIPADVADDVRTHFEALKASKASTETPQA